MNQQPTFTLVHEFDAPQKLVFNAFSNAEALNEWWGPAESRNTVISLDFRPGGIFHFQMDFSGSVAYGRFLFKKIRPHDLLEFTNAFADKNAQVVKAPFDVQLPLEIFYRLVFAENKGKTTITLTGRPVDASPEETAGFQSIAGSMEEGFGKTFDKLSVYLARAKTTP
ncbi:SRPBCC family protein [Chitinophaga barathri]|uniref:SRPBCC domain-containing protein n=1 Tax=Chitinophaga barathri TaxID=1647451 RepID=A0A3N4MVY2_9BACT|nr:SRPBCC domain-containing protein [Chitinophaga barathri]RPD39553.1 SRPBCC domain-containing protein [Chitinophaga barathri]